MGSTERAAVRPRTAVTNVRVFDGRQLLPLGIDYIGLSFVQRGADVAETQAIAAGRALVMVKLEKPQALDNLDEILDIADAVMVCLLTLVDHFKRVAIWIIHVSRVIPGIIF